MKGATTSLEQAKELCETLHSASRDTQTSATSGRLRDHPFSPEDEKITRRLPTAYPAGQHSDENQARPYRTSREREPGALVNEINLDGLSAGDEVFIETARSVYRFIVADPVIPCGRLSGGVLGSQPELAALMQRQKNSSCPTLTSNKLEAGLKVVFLIDDSKGLRRLTTSRIIRLVVRKNGRGGRHFDSPRTLRLEHVSTDQSNE